MTDIYDKRYWLHLGDRGRGRPPMETDDIRYILKEPTKSGKLIVVETIGDDFREFKFMGEAPPNVPRQSLHVIKSGNISQKERENIVNSMFQSINRGFYQRKKKKIQAKARRCKNARKKKTIRR
jgi:hypothetical protein